LPRKRQIFRYAEICWLAVIQKLPSRPWGEQYMFRKVAIAAVGWVWLIPAILLVPITGVCQDLADIKAQGVIRHLGVPYANFVTGSGDGLDVEIVQRFAQHLGVRYEYVTADWEHVLEDLIGRSIVYQPAVRTTGSRPIRGDIVANGLTILPNRMALIDYSTPTFPSTVWLIARADSQVTPIKPSGKLAHDIATTKARLADARTFVMDNSCLDPKLHGLEGRGYKLSRFTGSLNINEIIPALLKGESEMTLLDFPDILVAMERWQGRIKVIGPISEEQRMAAGFRKTSPALRLAFDEFFRQLRRDGSYRKLVDKYYPAAPGYLPTYFEDSEAGR
jgi:ABC-type amino acid transport substrate-binding protein